jgi:competence protein ComFB
MPKKSNKTAHVLSLLTNSPAEFDEIDTHNTEAATSPPVNITNDELKAEANSSILVEIQDQNDLISDLVKKELEQELNEHVKSEKFIFEEFDEEEYPDMSVKLNIEDTYEPSQANDTKILHNLAEDAMRIKVPEVMKTFNMCTCQSCIYDVMALALNHVTPLYTVTDKGQLYQKLSSYEMQYGTDLTSAITKACIKVKINPNHVSPDSKIPTDTE